MSFVARRGARFVSVAARNAAALSKKQQQQLMCGPVNNLISTFTSTATTRVGQRQHSRSCLCPRCGPSNFVLPFSFSRNFAAYMKSPATFARSYSTTTETGNDEDKALSVEDELFNEKKEEKEAREAAERARTHLVNALKPKEIVAELDRYIVGQSEAKRAVAIALRNRWRRHQLSAELREEVMPKNILMIGPTGVGKTEVARRLAKLAQAPFIKVEATKFTEVGFHGRDVDQIIRDLVEVSIQQTKVKLREQMREKAQRAAEERILEILVGDSAADTKEQFRQMLRDGDLDNREIQVEVPDHIAKKKNNQPQFEMSPGVGGSIPGLDSLLKDLSSAFRKTPSRVKKMKISKCRPILEEIEIEKMLNNESITAEAIRAVEEDGIVFIDEIDKICSKKEHRDGHDASSEGVQRDLLPLIEGTTISTKYGNVKTEHILFIASGAFHSVKPSDMLAELQGRLPIRVELKGLTRDDLYRILTEPKFNLLTQHIELLKTENLNLQFTDAAIREIAAVAAEVNSTVENIGARRLHTVLERIIEDISFDAPDKAGSTVVIDAPDVRARVGDMLSKTDLTKFIL
eukprot:GEZU01006911.1.p1 GENE.GEZU01006911.1~~GEZU01006911.1.p1  ORF type:complete len:576 (-),score=199.17 GEZU01006911.1:148-1875(-)